MNKKVMIGSIILLITGIFGFFTAVEATNSSQNNESSSWGMRHRNHRNQLNRDLKELEEKVKEGKMTEKEAEETRKEWINENDGCYDRLMDRNENQVNQNGRQNNRGTRGCH